ncbi:hypothetical protein ENUP19_0080G0034 [Entamoeba nuttalli]|uniref:Ran-binding protein, putative n=2 Tax=Entamoeba nuttalli TaxID=412467 RepID=K2HIJ5_ENTNP|nr:Ran-binding protein, putative [Entamoeba nuttalli P19]EKE42849.1 Ran-binding protein, putative [Entamoeba nuttalli P19]|eukprot:XP_008854818.1 Ran-binding protein, putative [Entamoeba nuttalli P19]
MSVNTMNLQQLEQLATQMYSAQTNQIIDFSPTQSQQILVESNNIYAQIHALKSFKKMADTISTTMEQKLQIKQFIYEFLSKRIGSLSSQTINIAIKTFVDLLKATWFDDPQNKTFINGLKDNALKDPNSIPFVFTLLVELTDNMSNTQNCTNRKATINYKDNCLKDIFSLSLEVFNLLLQKRPSNIEQLMLSTMKLMLSCLKYNFLGTNMDETTEDIYTVQIPNDWKNFFEDITFVQQLFNVYFNCKPPLTTIILDTIGYISLIRKSLWARQADGSGLQHCLIDGASKIVQSGYGLDNSETRFVFCRFLDRLKTNHPIHQIITTQHISCFSQFTINTFNNWSDNKNAVLYLLSFWNKVITSTQLNGDTQTETLLNQTALCLSQALVNSVLQFFEVMDYSDDDTVIDEEEFKLQDYMETLSSLAKAQYKEMAGFLTERIEVIVNTLSQISNATDYNSPLRKKLETQMCWLLTVMNAMLNRTYSNGNDNEQIQAALVGKIFRCMNLTDSIINYVNKTNQKSIEVKVEFEYMKFFGNFKNLYISASQYRTDTIQPLREVLGIDKIEDIVGKIMQKISFNLTSFPRNTSLIDKTLDTFLLFVSSCSQSKFIASLPFTQQLMQNHANRYFDFLSQSTTNEELVKLRRKYYSILGKILFQDESCDFMQFMRPFDTKLKFLITSIQSGTFNNDLVSNVDMLLSILIDLQGLLTVATTASQYIKFFEWFFFDYYENVLFAGVDANGSLFFNQVTTRQCPLLLYNTLKFLVQFTNSTYNRINFSNSSPNAILLFRAIVSTIKIIIPLLPLLPEKLFDNSIPRIFTIFNNFLTGNFIPYGVLIYYNDPALPSLMQCIMLTLFAIPLDKIFQESKFRVVVFTTLQGMFSVLYRFIFSSDVNTFQKLLMILINGLQSTDPNIIRSSMKIVSQIFDTYDSVQTRETENFASFESQIGKSQSYFKEMMKASMETMLFTEGSNQLRGVNCLVQLIKHFPVFFTEYKTALFNSQKTEQQKQLVLEKFKLIEDGVNESHFNDILNKALNDLKGNLSSIN